MNFAKKQTFRWMLATGLLLALSGCKVIPPEKEDDGPHPALLSELSAEERTELQNFGKESGEKLLAAIKSGQRSCMEGMSLHPEVAARITDESFKKLVTQIETGLGVITEQEYLTSLRASLLETFIWKVEFTKTSEEAGKAPTVVDMLFFVSVGRPDGKWQVMGFLFKL